MIRGLRAVLFNGLDFLGSGPLYTYYLSNGGAYYTDGHISYDPSNQLIISKHLNNTDNKFELIGKWYVLAVGKSWAIGTPGID